MKYVCWPYRVGCLIADERSHPTELGLLEDLGKTGIEQLRQWSDGDLAGPSVWHLAAANGECCRNDATIKNVIKMVHCLWDFIDIISKLQMTVVYIY